MLIYSKIKKINLLLIFSPKSPAGLYVNSESDNTYTHNTSVHVKVGVDLSLKATGFIADILSLNQTNVLRGFKTTINPCESTEATGLQVNIEGSSEKAYGANVAVTGVYKTDAIGYKGFVQSADYTYGFFGEAIGNNSQLAYGIYATANNANTVYAGYFDGDVYTTGSYLPSDKKLKENIVATGNVLNKLKLLQPVDYTYIQGKGLH